MLHTSRAILLVLAASAAGSCSGGESSNPEQPASQEQALYPWADGENEVMRMRVGLPPEIQVLADRVLEATQAQPEWAAIHAQVNSSTSPGEPLPWHENYGVTEEEYERISRSMREDGITLREDGPVRFTANTTEGVTRFVTDTDLATLGTISIDWNRDTLTTPWGIVTGSETHELTGDETIAPFKGRIWHMQEGGAGAMRVGSNHKAVSIRVLVGERENGKFGYMHLKIISANNGVIYVNDETILQWEL